MNDLCMNPHLSSLINEAQCHEKQYPPQDVTESFSEMTSALAPFRGVMLTL